MSLRSLFVGALLGLVAACNQSLFDAHSGGTPDGAVAASPDAEEVIEPPDASPPPIDAVPADADPLSVCSVEECSNLFVDFTRNIQPGPWHYREDRRDPRGLDYVTLTWGLWNNLSAWVGSTAPPAIVKCQGLVEDDTCDGLEGRVLMVPTTTDAGDVDPALEFPAPFDGVYGIQGDLKIADGSPAGVEQSLLVSRNSRHDLLQQLRFMPGHTPETFDVLLEAQAGDRLFLALAPHGPGPATPVGIRANIVRWQSLPHPDAGCMLALSFDEADPFQDRCGNAGMQITNMDYETGTGTTETTSVNERYGKARHIALNQYLEGNTVLDLSGDFTIQFWMLIEYDHSVTHEDPEDGWPWGTVYADWNCYVGGGVNISMNDGYIDAHLIHRISGLDQCASSEGSHDLFFEHPQDEGWHFYRMVRDTQDTSVSFCIDGVLQEKVVVPGDVDLTSDEPPRIGRNVTYNPPYFVGAIDDLRVEKRALPCPTAP